MSIASVTEISATSPKRFEDAIQPGIARASATLRHVKSTWVTGPPLRLAIACALTTARSIRESLA